MTGNNKNCIKKIEGSCRDEDAPEFILDTSATMPSGWLENEPEMVPDETAIKPDDWDPEMDGEWEPPSISALILLRNAK